MFDMATANSVAIKKLSKNGLNKYTTSPKAKKTKIPKNKRLLFIYFSFQKFTLYQIYLVLKI